MKAGGISACGPSASAGARQLWEHAGDAPYPDCGAAPGKDWYIAQCPEVDVASQGHTIDEALANLAEAVEPYLQEVDDPAGYITATPLVTRSSCPPRESRAF